MENALRFCQRSKAKKTCAVEVEVQAEKLEGSFLVQRSKTIEAGGIHFEGSLLLPTTAPQVLLVSNWSEFTQELTELRRKSWCCSQR